MCVTIAAATLDAEPFTDGLGPMQRWERDREMPDVVEVICQRVAEGERLKEICKSRGWPYSRVALWVAETEAVAKAYEQALRLGGDALAMETVSLADGAQPETVGVAKLQVDTRFKLAGKLYRERYGEVVRQELVLDPFTEMLRRVSERRLAALRQIQNPGITERVVEALPIPAEHDLI